MEQIRESVIKILLDMAKDEGRAERDRIKACETLLKMAGKEEAEGEEDREMKVVIEYGRGGGR